jgi:hypothetical protein
VSLILENKVNRNITVTWEEINWSEVSDDNIPDPLGGFIVDGFMISHHEGMSRDELVNFHNDAKQDLNSMIDCEFCSDWLIEDSFGNWVDTDSHFFGKNKYDGINSHRHKPEKYWHHILVDIMEQYGVYEFNGLSWYSDYSVVDYKYGIERQYAVHIEWNIEPYELEMIEREIELRRKSRAFLAI